MTLIESEQSKDTQLTQIARGPFYLRFASYRKGEDAKLDLRSEDYIVSELTPEKAIFGLCDGVGSSYYGNIGSQFLGETILNWLDNLSPPNRLSVIKDDSLNIWSASLADNLKEELDNKKYLATSLIQNRKTVDRSELIQLAEKTQRDDFGTQSNFVGGIIWPKSNDFPDGLVLLFWLGNARIRIFNTLEDKKIEELTYQTNWGNNPEQLKEVWSSKEGVVGRVYSYLTDYSKISTIIAYSDGMEGVEEKITPNIQGVNLEGLIRQAQSIKDDDVAYLEISLAEGDIKDYSDDIVKKIRNRYISNIGDVISEPSPELEGLRIELEQIKKAKGELSKDLQKSKRTNKLLTILIIIFVFSICLLAGGYFIERQKMVVITPPLTSFPTITPIPPSITASITPSMVPSLLPSPPSGPFAITEPSTLEILITPDLPQTLTPALP